MTTITVREETLQSMLSDAHLKATMKALRIKDKRSRAYLDAIRYSNQYADLHVGLRKMLSKKKAMSTPINIEEHLLVDKIATAYAVGFYAGMKHHKPSRAKTPEELMHDVNEKGMAYAKADREISKTLKNAMKKVTQ